jgi:diguanylate cyclase
LRRALEREELELRYQPMIELATATMVGAEALLRWRLDGVLLEPREFIQVAEEARLVGPIGEWVLATACAQAVTWQEPSRAFKLAVNLSPMQIQDLRFTALVARVLESTGLDPALLELEITEGAAMENAPRTISLLTEIKALGVALAIDDFGTGYSSLSYLQRFPLDHLKVDQSFVHAIGRGIGAGAIINATLSMARALELQVTAEGVETSDQLAFLREHGCHRAQGFFFGRPLTPGALAALLAATRSRAATA